MKKMTKERNDRSLSEAKEEEIIEEEPKETDDQESEEPSEDEEKPDEIELLRQELEGARAKADEYLDGWQRARAEFANYKKRIERDNAQTYKLAAASIIKRYLDIVDDLERALNDRPKEGEGAKWADGIELIYRKLLSTIENEGVTPMETQGQFFDPNLHEAISSEDSEEHESGQIIDVLQRGYMLDDRVLRPALVRVAR